MDGWVGGFVGRWRDGWLRVCVDGWVGRQMGTWVRNRQRDAWVCRWGDVDGWRSRLGEVR